MTTLAEILGSQYIRDCSNVGPRINECNDDERTNEFRACTNERSSNYDKRSVNWEPNETSFLEFHKVKPQTLHFR